MFDTSNCTVLEVQVTIIMFIILLVLFEIKGLKKLYKNMKPLLSQSKLHSNDVHTKLCKLTTHTPGVFLLEDETAFSTPSLAKG